jgi:hypothetical protein
VENGHWRRSPYHSRTATTGSAPNIRGISVARLKSDLRLVVPIACSIAPSIGRPRARAPASTWGCSLDHGRSCPRHAFRNARQWRDRRSAEHGPSHLGDGRRRRLGASRVRPGCSYANCPGRGFRAAERGPGPLAPWIRSEERGPSTTSPRRQTTTSKRPRYGWRMGNIYEMTSPERLEAARSALARKGISSSAPRSRFGRERAVAQHQSQRRSS